MNTLLLSLVLASTSAADRVVVYPDRAQVTRLVSVPCGNRTPITFTGIPPAAAADSFRSRMSEGTVDGLRATLENQLKTYGARVQAITDQLEGTQLERRVLDDQLARLREQIQIARKYSDIAARTVSREMSLERPDLKSWAQAFDTSLASELAAVKASADAEAKQREVMRKEEQLQRQRDELNVAAAKQAYSVEVLVSCPEGRNAELSLTYLVGGASWSPAYEARADEGASLVEFATWATVTQRTGEDWSGVELSLSTAIPAQNATPPELKKLIVNTWERPPEKKVLVRRDEYVEHADAAEGGKAESAGGLVARNQGLSVQLQIPEKGQVPGDGAPVRLLVGRTPMKATFELWVMPKLSPFAFRIAELTNQAAWPLLPGRLDAFRANGLTGRYALERVPQGGFFSLTFGVEESVRVKRTVVEELRRDTGILGNTRRFTFAYRFELANYGKGATTVALSDHLPVSELDDIAIAVGEKTSPGYQFGKQDGLVKWKVPLKAQEKKSIDLSFRVDVPTSYETGGL